MFKEEIAQTSRVCKAMLFKQCSTESACRLRTAQYITLSQKKLLTEIWETRFLDRPVILDRFGQFGPFWASLWGTPVVNWATILFTCISFISSFVECSPSGLNFVHKNYEYLNTKILLQRIGLRTWVLEGRDCGHIIDDHLSLQRLCATVTKEVQPVKGSLTLSFYESFVFVFLCL